MRCSDCGTAMKPLMTSWFCPNDCDKVKESPYVLCWTPLKGEGPYNWDNVYLSLNPPSREGYAGWWTCESRARPVAAIFKKTQLRPALSKTMRIVRQGAGSPRLYWACSPFWSLEEVLDWVERLDRYAKSLLKDLTEQRQLG